MYEYSIEVRKVDVLFQAKKGGKVMARKQEPLKNAKKQLEDIFAKENEPNEVAYLMYALQKFNAKKITIEKS